MYFHKNIVISLSYIVVSVDARPDPTREAARARHVPEVRARAVGAGLGEEQAHGGRVRDVAR